MIAKAPIAAHRGAGASALGDGCRVKDHLVVGDMIVTFDQKLLVLGIEHCLVNVRSGELPDGALRIPQRDQQELGLPVCHPAEREHPAVSLDLPVFGQAGLVLGVAGVALLTGGDGAGAGSMTDRLALLGGGLSWAAGSLIGRDGPKPQSVAQSTAMQLLGGGLVVLLLSAATGELSGWSAHQLTSRAIISVGFLVFGGTVLGFGAYTWLLQATSTAAAGTYAFVNPMVALALAWLVGDEPFELRTVLAGIVVVAGVLLIWSSSARESHPREEARHPQRGGESALRRVLRALEMTRYADAAARIRPRANPD